jgi:hypothetical protein
MAQKTIDTRIVLRNDSTGNWATVKDTAKLLQGEVGIEILGNGKTKMKIGDGVSTWAELPYFGGEEAKYFEVESLDDITETELAKGDIAVVKTAIYIDAQNAGNNKYSYTGYTWNGEAWAAMDGNYSAKNVFLESDITLAGSFTTVGNYNKGKKIAAGTSLESILSGMLQQELYPTANDKPNAEITASGGSGEVGTEYTVPTATLKITDVGSYEYGDKATDITFAIGNVKLAEGADPATATNYKTNDSVMAKDSTITLKADGDKVLYADTSKSYTFSGTASYSAGKVPVTNLGNEYADAQIPAGDVTIADKTVTFSGYRYAFAGGTTAAAIDSAVVRSMTAKKNSKASMDTEGEALEFVAAQGATKIFFAYPATWTGTPYFEMFGLAWAENGDFVALDNIQVADARGTVDGALQGAVAYKLYAWTPAGPLTAESTKFRVWFK